MKLNHSKSTWRNALEGTPLGAIHRWLTTPPKNLAPAFKDFYSLSNYTHAFGLISHVLFLIIFIVFKVEPLAYFNLFSIGVFMATLGWSKAGKLDLALLVGGLEVGTHQAFAVYVLGLEPAFQNYLLILVIGTLFYGHIPLHTRIVMAIVPVIEYVGIYWHALHHSPVQHLDPFTIDFLAAMNIVFYIVILMGICIYFQHSVQQSGLKAEKMAQSKTLFLANMSHELRTPLNAILGFAQILKRSTTLTEQEHRNLATINRSGEHLLELINGILDMSKLEEGKLALQKTTFDLPRLLNDLHAMFQLAARNKQIELRVEHSGNLPTLIKTDELRLRQILINLLGNALKFTQRGYIRLAVQVLDRPAQGQTRLKFQVEDTGGGIAKTEIGDLFQLFTQTESGRQSRKGTGLGLALSRRFVELMEGEIGVESEPGKGSIFWFIIPVEIDNTSPAPITTDTNQIIRVRVGTRRHRMLVVDDNAENREVLLQLLSGLGFEMASAADGAEGVLEWKKFAPDLVWMDLRMPVMDGYESCKTIHRIASEAGQPKPKIIAITASSLEEGHTRAEQAGFAAVVGKPFRETDIYALIKQHLNIDFVYATREAPAANATPPAQADLQVLLTDLAPQLRQPLLQAATLTDFDGVQSVTRQLAETNPALASKLNDLLENYRFDLIQEALEKPPAGKPTTTQSPS